MQYFPRIFREKYGNNLRNIVKLWMPDRHVWIAYFSHEKQCVEGLQRLLEHYSVVENYIFLFHYIGESTFYMTMFSNNGIDALKGLRKRMLITEVVVCKNERPNEGIYLYNLLV